MSSKGEFLGYLNRVYTWVDNNVINIITTAITIGIVLIIYRFIVSEINRLRKREVIDHNTAFLFRRISKWTAYIIFAVLIFNTLGIKIDFLLGLWVLAGGTIVGFASMSTIGNALAGLIIMVSRPFKIRDRLYFQDQFVVVEDIDLIYTRMRTLDNVVISVPNQILLETVVANQSAYDVVRRRCTVTVDYSEKPMNIRGILLAAIGKVEEVIDEPEPYVWITDFPNFAMEYTLFYYIADTQRSQMIDSRVREAVVEEFAVNGMDLSTPNLVRSMK
ncbi:mechanosensitive ion channel [Candidatus Bathyarchaeota archaeon]|nr:mechanosensitive ion channel [Candidatus Bathyarchaeota archaeon]